MSKLILAIISHRIKIEVEAVAATALTNHPITRAIVKSTIMRQAIVAEDEVVMGVTESAPAVEYLHGSTQQATKNTARDKNNNNKSNNLILSMMSQLPNRRLTRIRNLTMIRISPMRKGSPPRWLTTVNHTTTPIRTESQPLEKRQCKPQILFQSHSRAVMNRLAMAIT